MLSGIWRYFQSSLSRYVQDTRGVSVLVFAFSLPMFVAASGVATDLAQAYNVKNRLSNALDKAALAGGSTAGTEEEVEQQILNFFEANYPEEGLGTAITVTATMQNNVINVRATARVDTSFMRIFNYDYLDVHAESEVVRELGGVEVVLVLDVTGSMSGSKIQALKNAVCNNDTSASCREKSFVQIMFERIQDPEYLKIGIVPFSNTVNVGRYGLGQFPDGTYYSEPFVDRPEDDDYINPPENIMYSSTGSGNNWMGCILERTYPADTTDASSPNWGMYRRPQVCSRYRSNGTCREYSNNNPNSGCQSSQIVPMTNVEATIRTSIYSLVASGNTYGNVGMAWGYRVISPGSPYTEGVAFDDNEWTKTVVFMGDGDNVSGGYSAYANNSPSAAQLDTRFLETCANMKADGITIYTISFDGGSGISQDTKDMFEQCASSP